MCIALIVVLFCLVGDFAILHFTTTSHLKRRLILSSNLVSNLSRAQLDNERHTECIQDELDQLIKSDAESFGGLIRSMAYDVDMLPTDIDPSVTIRAKMPELHCRMNQRDLIHRDSIKIMAEDISRRLYDLSLVESLKFLSENLAVRRII